MRWWEVGERGGDDRKGEMRGESKVDKRCSVIGRYG